IHPKTTRRSIISWSTMNIRTPAVQDITPRTSIIIIYSNKCHTVAPLSRRYTPRLSTAHLWCHLESTIATDNYWVVIAQSITDFSITGNLCGCLDWIVGSVCDEILWRSLRSPRL